MKRIQRLFKNIECGGEEFTKGEKNIHRSGLNSQDLNREYGKIQPTRPNLATHKVEMQTEAGNHLKTEKFHSSNTQGLKKSIYPKQLSP